MHDRGLPSLLNSSNWQRKQEGEQRAKEKELVGYWHVSWTRLRDPFLWRMVRVHQPFSGEKAKVRAVSLKIVWQSRAALSIIERSAQLQLSASYPSHAIIVLSNHSHLTTSSDPCTHVTQLWFFFFFFFFKFGKKLSSDFTSYSNCTFWLI